MAIAAWRGSGRRAAGGAAIAAAVVAALGGAAAAQVTPDGSLSTTVRREGETWTISGGDRAGENLFHSFRSFSVPTGGAAQFDVPSEVANIFSRVTGGEMSAIDGTLRAGSGANLFLLNPAGIVFGPNARLDLGGSFFASTADRLAFADGATFAATLGDGGPPLLTASVPVGVQFGRQPGPLRVGLPAAALPGAVAPTTAGETADRAGQANGGRPAELPGLQVQPGRDLFLAGGDLFLAGTAAIAPAGTIALVGAGPGETVPLNLARDPLALPGPTGGAVRLAGGAIASTSGPGGGAIAVRGDAVSLSGQAALRAETAGALPGGGLDVRGRSVRLSGGALLSTATQGAGRGGDLSVTATESISVAGGLDIRDRLAALLRLEFGPESVTDGLFAFSAGPGAAGNLTLAAPQIELSGGALALTSAFGPGLGGDVVAMGDEIALRGAAIVAGTTGPSPSGNVFLNARQIRLFDGGLVGTTTLGPGRGGDITVKATDTINITSPFASVRKVVLDEQGIFALGTSGLFALGYGANSGDTGAIVVQTNQLYLTAAAQILSSSYGPGKLGSISIFADDRIEILGGNPFFSNDLELEEFEEDTVFFTGIVGSAVGPQPANQVIIKTSDLVISGLASIAATSGGFSGAFTDSGSGGGLRLSVRRLILSNGGSIRSSTDSRGDAGQVTIFASESIDLLGQVAITDESARGSEIFAGSIEIVSTFVPANELGSAGEVTVRSPEISIRDGARIAVSNAGPESGGNLRLTAETIALDGGEISAATAGDLGNLSIQTDRLILRNGSRILTDSTGSGIGGNIAIAADLLAALENSDITANALNNRGGRVEIDTRALFGAAVRPSRTDRSDITASSALGPEFRGTIRIDRPDLDPSREAIDLPETVVPLPPPLTGCVALGQTEAASLVETGRGTLRPSLADAGERAAPEFWEDWRWPLPAEELAAENLSFDTALPLPTDIPLESAEAAKAQPLDPTELAGAGEPIAGATVVPPFPLVEATGWQRTDRGEIRLVGDGPSSVPSGTLPCSQGARATVSEARR